MVTKTDYNQIAVKAAYSVLIEIVRVLGEYRDYIVLIGGWVPQFLFQNRLDDLVAEFRPHLKNGLIQEGLAKLAKNYYPTCPVPPTDGTGVAPADSTGVKPFFMLSGAERIYPGQKTN